MKFPRSGYLNRTGFAHHLILPALVMVAVAAIGVHVLTGSHADTVNYSVRMNAGQSLAAGSEITASSGGVRLLMQTDGNLVLYTGASIPIWSSGTGGTGSNNRAVMQRDGNFVVYTSANKAVWSSGTGGTGSADWVTVQTDGNLVVYTSSSRAVWSSGTGATQLTEDNGWDENDNPKLVYHNAGRLCTDIFFAPRLDWCSNSASAGSRATWYGPRLTLSAKTYDFVAYMEYYWTNSAGKDLQAPTSGNKLTVDVTDNDGKNTLAKATISGYYENNGLSCTNICSAVFPINNEPIREFEIRAYSISAPSGSGDTLHIFDTELHSAGT